MSFIASNYSIFLIIAIVLLLGLFGYMMDRKKYEKYRQEIINEERVAEALESVSTVSDSAAMQIPESDPMQPLSGPTDQVPDIGASQAPLIDPVSNNSGGSNN